MCEHLENSDEDKENVVITMNFGFITMKKQLIIILIKIVQRMISNLIFIWLQFIAFFWVMVFFDLYDLIEKIYNVCFHFLC